MQTYEMQLNADQIVEETSDWPKDAVADRVDRMLRAKYGEIDRSADRAWHDETGRRIADMESGKVQEIPLQETVADSVNPAVPVASYARYNLHFARRYSDLPND